MLWTTTTSRCYIVLLANLLSVLSQFPITLELLCFGAIINKKALKEDKTGLLVQIEERLEKLRNGEYRIMNLCSNEENKFKWNLAFCLTLKYKVAAFQVYIFILQGSIVHHF
jgi:hypothetical protein